MLLVGLANNVDFRLGEELNGSRYPRISPEPLVDDESLTGLCEPTSVIRYRLIALLGFFLSLHVLAAELEAHGNEAHRNDAHKNIVLILIDDAALMDLGAYGGEARTPNIDDLARRGALFTQYRTSPLCSPTRAMLLTGIDNHQSGVATIPEVLPPEHVGQPGYTMALESGVLTIADRLRSQGYRTLMSGKWHLGEHAHEMPQNHGFDRSFALAASGADNWDDKAYMPFYDDAPWWEDGVETSRPEGFYSSEFLVDKMISYLADTDASKPFFAYLPFQAIHIPIQAPPEFVAHYRGVYDEGWQRLRERRYERAQALGLIPEAAALAAMPDGFRNWDALSEKERLLYRAMMEVNAAMLEAMDHHIGRFLSHLESQGLLDSTVIVVTSDNGPEYNRGDDDWRLRLWQATHGYHLDPQRAGQRGSWGFIGPEWAMAAASPSNLFKFYATEGGVRVPLIVAGPSISPAKIRSPAMVTDVTPTLLDYIGALGHHAEMDAASATGQTPVRQMTGRSLMPVLRGEVESAYGADDIRAIEVSGNSALYKGSYKITRSMPPLGDGQWQLFDLSLDPGETRDLSDSKPLVLADLKDAYANYAQANGVLEMPLGYDSAEAIERNSMMRFVANNLSLVLSMAALFLLAVVLLLRSAVKAVYPGR
ncbi:MAG: arylsulfatase [Pseudomonadota bacterium]